MLCPCPPAVACLTGLDAGVSEGGVVVGAKRGDTKVGGGWEKGDREVHDEDVK